MGRSRSRLWLGARASPGQRTIRLRVAGARFVGQLAVGFEPDARCASFVGEVNLGLVADVLSITRAVLVDPGTSDFNLHRNRLACLAIGISPALSFHWFSPSCLVRVDLGLMFFCDLLAVAPALAYRATPGVSIRPQRDHRPNFQRPPFKPPRWTRRAPLP